MELTLEQKRAIAIAKAKQALAEAESVTAQAPEAQKPPEQHSAFESAISGAAQGLTFGFADEAKAGVRSAVDWVRGKAGLGPETTLGDAYSRNLDHWRGELDEMRAEDPIAAYGGEVAGAIALPGASMKAGASVGANALRGAKIGAASGGVYGFGAGEGGFEDRAGSAAVGAGIGAAAGATIPLVAEGVKRIASGLSYIKGLKGPEAERRAQEMLTEALKRDGISLDDLARMGASGKPVTIADLGPNTRDVIGSAARQGGKGKETLDTFFEDRTLGQYQRMTDDVSAGTGVRGQDFAATADDIANQRAAAAGPQYREAYKQSAPALSDNATAILSTPDGKRAVATAERFMANKRKPMRDESGNYTVEALDQIQRAMRDASNKAKGARGTEQAANISSLRDEFLTEVPEELRGAMANYRGKSELLDAMQQGRAFLKGDAEAIGSAMADMSPQQQEMFRLGAARQLRERMGQKVDTGDISGMFRNPQMRERLAAVFPDEKSLNEFLEKVATEKTMQETRNAILKGSQTAGRGVADEEFTAGALGEAALDLATGGGRASLGRAVIGMATRGKDRYLQGVNERVAEEVARMGTLPIGDASASLSRQIPSAALRYALPDASSANALRFGARPAIPAGVNWWNQ